MCIVAAARQDQPHRKCAYLTPTVMWLLPRPRGPMTYLAIASSAHLDLQSEAKETGNLHDAADPEATTAAVAVGRIIGMDNPGSDLGSPPPGNALLRSSFYRAWSNPCYSYFDGIAFGDKNRRAGRSATPQQY